VITDEIIKLIPLWITYFFAAASPGPAQVFVVEKSLLSSKKEGRLAALGVSLGTCVWVLFVGVGVQKLSQSFAGGHMAIRILSIGLLGFFILKNLHILWNQKINPKTKSSPRSQQKSKREKSSRIFFKGFLTNMLNPNSVVFFISLFGPLLAEQKSAQTFLIATFGVTLISIGWYQFVAEFCHFPIVKSLLLKSETLTRVLFTSFYVFFLYKLLVL
jgi:threonine/homoserine/homoserine lactone efflux protein